MVDIKKSFEGDSWGIGLGEKIVSPQKMLDMLSRDTSNIDSIEFLPPRKGENSFGKFKVKGIFPFFPEVE